MTGLVEKIKLSPEYTNEIKTTPLNILKETRSQVTTEKVLLAKQKSEKEKAIRELEDLRFVKNGIQDEAFLRIYGRYTEELKNIDKKFDSLQSDQTDKTLTLERLLTLTENLGYSYRTALAEQKRQYLSIFFSKLLIKNGKIVDFTYKQEISELITIGSIRVLRLGRARRDSNPRSSA